MRLHRFYDVEQFRKPSPATLARRAVIAAEMARVAKAAESHLPADERRQIFDLRELRRAATECAVACAVAAPVAVGVVFWQLTQIY